MPKLRESLRQRWPTLIPLVLLISILVSGRTPYLAAFSGISSCAIVGLTTLNSGNTAKNWVMLVVLHAFLAVIAFADLGQQSEWIKLGLFAAAIAVALAGWLLGGVTGRIKHSVLVEAFETGAKYA